MSRFHVCAMLIDALDMGGDMERHSERVESESERMKNERRAEALRKNEGRTSVRRESDRTSRLSVTEGPRITRSESDSVVLKAFTACK